MYKSKYRDDIEFLSSKGTMTAREIAEEIGCSISAVYLHTPKGCFEHLHSEIRMVNGLLRCRKCKQYYPTENFNKDKSKKYCYQEICKECNKKQAKNYRLKIKGEKLWPLKKL